MYWDESCLFIHIYSMNWLGRTKKWQVSTNPTEPKNSRIFLMMKSRFCPKSQKTFLSGWFLPWVGWLFFLGLRCISCTPWDSWLTPGPDFLIFPSEVRYISLELEVNLLCWHTTLSNRRSCTFIYAHSGVVFRKLKPRASYRSGYVYAHGLVCYLLLRVNTIKTGIAFRNGSSILNLLRWVFHSQIKLKCSMKMWNPFQ